MPTRRVAIELSSGISRPTREAIVSTYSRTALN